jgi:hypothetical protein
MFYGCSSAKIVALKHQFLSTTALLTWHRCIRYELIIFKYVYVWSLQHYYWCAADFHVVAINYVVHHLIELRTSTLASLMLGKSSCVDRKWEYSLRKSWTLLLPIASYRKQLDFASIKRWIKARFTVFMDVTEALELLLVTMLINALCWCILLILTSYYNSKPYLPCLWTAFDGTKCALIRKTSRVQISHRKADNYWEFSCQ